ncbi:MAG TPA: hypothetical protein VFG96_10200 [Jiangellaceae bacterium]|nr:hypothetical protein [Jiangellaceae bacterium]
MTAQALRDPVVQQLAIRDLVLVGEVAAAQAGQMARAGAQQPSGLWDRQLISGIARLPHSVGGDTPAGEVLHPGQLRVTQVAGPVAVDQRDQIHPGIVPVGAADVGGAAPRFNR